MPNDELYRHWQVARLTEPLHRLAIRSATKADFDHDRYDLVQLALRAIDYVVTHQASMAGTVTPDEVIALNCPGMRGDSIAWKGRWSHGRDHQPQASRAEALPA